MNIRWIGPARETPCGMMARGTEREVPEADAQSYVAQGLAEPVPELPEVAGEPPEEDPGVIALDSRRGRKPRPEKQGEDR